jgi:Gas vesicle synthesis protein GvpO
MPTRRAVRSSRKTDGDRGPREPDDELAEEQDDELDEEQDDELDEGPDDELDDELDEGPDDELDDELDEGPDDELAEEPDDELPDEPGDEAEAVADDDDGDSGRRVRRHRDGGLTAAKAGRLALRQIGELTGKQAEAITGVEPGEDGWIVGVEVVEDRRVPSSADILATYETVVDTDGELVSYRRVRRYSRGRGDSEG